MIRRFAIHSLYLFFKNIFFPPAPYPKKKILIVSLQKCGTHLIKKIMAESGYQSVCVGKNVGMHHFRGLRDNQYLLSHFTPSDEIQMAIEDGDESLFVLFNYRDPRDVIVSWYYWMHPKHGGEMHLHQEFMRKVYSNFTDEELIYLFIRNEKLREVEYNPIEHFRQSRVLLFHPKVLNVRFEDIVGSGGGGNDDLQRATIKKIFKYLELENLDIDLISSNAYDNNSKTFRKGKIGGYVDELSKDQIILMNELHGDVIKQYDYPLDKY